MNALRVRQVSVLVAAFDGLMGATVAVVAHRAP